MHFLQVKVLNNDIKGYIIVCFAIIIAFIIKIVAEKLLATINTKVIQKKWAFVTQQEFSINIAKPFGNAIFVLIIVTAFDSLHYPSAFNYLIKKVPLHQVLQRVGDAIVAVFFFYFLLKVIDFVASILIKASNGADDKGHDQIIIFLKDLIKIVVVVFAVLLLIKILFNQNVAHLLTGLSIVGAAVALAAKESIENLIASFIIFFDKPFFTGDTLKVNTVIGTVEHIGLRSTRIRTLEKTLVTVPNKQMVDSVVDNMSMRSLRRAEIKLSLSDKTTTIQIQNLIADVNKVIESMPSQIEKHNIHFTELSKDGMIVLFEYFTPPFTRAEYDAVRQEINFTVIKLLTKNSIEMSSPSNSINIISPDGHSILPKQDNLI